jgi:hypothetical protein
MTKKTTSPVRAEKACTRAIMHSTNIHESYYLLHLIDSALWLLDHELGLQEVEIVLHPIGVFHTPITIFQGLKRRLFTLPFTIFSAIKRHLGRVKEVISYRVNSQAGEKGYTGVETGSIFAQVNQGRYPVILTTEIGTIIIHRSGRRLIKSLMEGVQTYLTARRLWRTCHENDVLQPKRLLQLNYGGIVIGDLVASMALRQYPQSGGSMQACPGLWPTLLNAVAIRDYITTNIPSDCQNSYVIIPEPTYLHALYSRLLHKQGACVLARYHYAKEFVLISPQQDLYNPKVVQTKKFTPPSDEDILRAKTYLQERIEQPNKHLWYMLDGVNCIDEQLWDTEDNLIEDVEGGLSAVVFLHCFDDAQYFYGVDGFDDLYHWTIFTIDKLIDNPNVTKVFIKPHPSINFINYKGDKVALERLCDRYAENRKIIWLRKDCSLKAIAKLGRVVGVTHHGSVAEELTYLGIPVVASAVASWGTAFAFVNIWRNPEEYKTLLNHLSGENWAKPSTAMIDDLLGYIVEYRLNAISIYARSPWMKYGHWADGEVPKVTTFSYYRRRLDQLSSGDAITSGLLEWLICERRAAKSNR